MKLKKGVTVHIGSRKFKGEISDTLAEKAGLKKTEAPKPKTEEKKKSKK